MESHCPTCKTALDEQGLCPECTPIAGRPTTQLDTQVTVIGGRYELVERLGEGGMGEVWEAYDRRLKTTVALKMVSERVAGDADTRERFHQEVLLARQVRHPNVAAVYDLFEEDGRTFFTMELVPGRSLSDVLGERLELEEALSLGRDIVRGLAAMHEAGLVHRDIKPANIRVTPDGKAKLLDLGIAKDLSRTSLTQAGWVVGTPDYMAPEQAQGRAVTASADVYAFGLVLYRMLTGRRVDNSSIQEETRMTLAAPSKINPEIPPWLDRVLAVCLEPRPQRRYPDAVKLLRDLEEERRPTTQRTVTVSRGTLVGVTGGTALVLAALLAVGLFWWLRPTPEIELERRPLIDPGGQEAGATLSADGETLFYAAFRGGNAEIYRVDTGVNAAPQRRTDSPALEMEAVLSHDGDRLAVSAVGESLGTRVGILPAAGDPTTPRWLEQQGHRPRWSPGDDRLLVHVGRSDPPTPDVVLVHLGSGGGRPRGERRSLRDLLGLERRRSLSAADWWDEDHVVAVVGGVNVVRFDVAEGKLEPLFDAPGPVLDLCVDRANGEIAVLSRTATAAALYLWGGDWRGDRQGEPRRLGEGDYLELTGCRQRQFLLTEARPSMRIFLAPLVDGELRLEEARPLSLGTAAGSEEREFMPELAPLTSSTGASKLAFISSSSGQDEVVLQDFGQDLDQALGSSGRQVVSSRGGELRWPSFSPDGRRLAYSSKVEGDGDILIYDLESGEETNLTQSFDVYEGAPDWFPDGASLVINEKRGGQWDLVRITYPGGAREKLTDDKVVDIDPAVHPQGDRIAFHRDGVIHVLTPATGELVPVVPGSTPRWRADGEAILFQANGDLWSVPHSDGSYDGQPPTRLTFHPWPSFRLEGVWKFSVRGNRVVYSVIEHRSGRIVHLAPAGEAL